MEELDKLKTKGYDLSLIDENNVIAAIKHIDDNGVPSNAHSSTYDLVYNNKAYPPKLVLSLAYKYATGKELDRSLFEGGIGTACFNQLQKLGFAIEPKQKNIELLFKKEVDYSLLVEGITIPNEELPKFLHIYGEIPAGKKSDLQINLEGSNYKADLRHINRTNTTNVFQIRYPKNGKLATHLKNLYSEAFDILEEIRKNNEGAKKTFAKLPSDKKEYLDIYHNTKNNQLVFKRSDETYSFIPVIQKFIKQADENKNLAVNQYPKEYQELKVSVSFGKGNYAAIPWISFLYDGQTTSKGIYPVLLYYKDLKLLILAYGVSETNKPDLTWNCEENVSTISDYFKSQRLGKPQRYGNSHVYKVYKNISQIDNTDIDNDLKEIISTYKNLMDSESKQTTNKKQTNRPFDIREINTIKQTGLLFSEDLLYRYTISLLTKPFVILSGLSGSGKTRLALTFAKWLSGSETQVKIVSVGSDWNNREYLLGYPNALDCGKYIKPDNGILDFLLEAIKDPAKPYFLILDEMNLSYVERYFADFLSTMESHEPITLHPDTPDWFGCDVPAQITLPRNLFITGTINVDETTYMFSPKVLDRANVIEFRISEVEMSRYLTDFRPPELDIINHKAADMAGDFLNIGKNNNYQNSDIFNEILISFFKELKIAGAEFGYRTVSEIYRFITIAQNLGTHWGSQVMQRLDD